MKNEDWALFDRQALGVVRLTLSRNIAFNIAKEKTTAGLMAALSRASVAQHLNELNTITTQLTSVETEFDDEIRALILLSSLPDSWNATVTTVSSSSGNSKLKFDDVQDLVLSEEIRQRESGEASSSSALHTESRGRTSKRNLNRGRSKSRRGKSITEKKDFNYYNCDKKSHFKRDCRAPKKDTGAQESANITEETGDVMILSVNSPIESWILDSVASFHSTPCREIMENYISGDFEKVHLADDETLKIVEKGDIRLKLPNQTTWKLKGVRHILGLKRNLIFVEKLDREGYRTTFSGLADADGKSILWHQRLGHMSEKGMKTLLSKGKLSDLKNIDVGLCEDCIFGKQKKVSFAKIGKTPKAEKLELVHTDVWGPSPIPSLSGSLYYVTFIDDSTRKIKMETIVPMTPQQNGVAERMNRTLNERDKKNRKIIRSRDVVFNENVMYKDRLTIESSSSNTEAETKKLVEFEEISRNDVQISPEAVQEEPGIPELRRSSIIPKPTNVEDSVKESSIKDEMDSLMLNQMFQQKEDIDYNEIFSPVVKLSTIRLVLKIVAAENLHLEQLDVKAAFLHGDLEEEIYMRQLRKTWLRHARDYKLEAKIVEAVCNERSRRCKADSWEFNLQDVKPVSTHLGVHFKLSKEQSLKTEEERAHMVKVSYASLIGSLMYVIVCTRPDISHAVGVVSRYMNNPGKVHWEAVKWILRYLRGTTNKTLYFKGGDTILTGYVDADLARNIDIRRSNVGYVYTLRGTAMSLVSQLQKIVALFTTEVEYVAVTEASKEMVWLQSFLEMLGKKQENNTLYCDSQSVIHLAKNLSFHSRTKHIQLRYHFIWSLLEDGILKLEKISRAQNPADMLTKTVEMRNAWQVMEERTLLRKENQKPKPEEEEISMGFKQNNLNMQLDQVGEYYITSDPIEDNIANDHHQATDKNITLPIYFSLELVLMAILKGDEGTQVNFTLDGHIEMPSIPIPSPARQVESQRAGGSQEQFRENELGQQFKRNKVARRPASILSALKIAKLVELPSMVLMDDMFVKGNQEIPYPEPLLDITLPHQPQPHEPSSTERVVSDNQMDYPFEDLHSGFGSPSHVAGYELQRNKETKRHPTLSRDAVRSNGSSVSVDGTPLDFMVITQLTRETPANDPPPDIMTQNIKTYVVYMLIVYINLKSKINYWGGGCGDMKIHFETPGAPNPYITWQQLSSSIRRVIASQGFLKVKQGEPFGDISISKGEKITPPVLRYTVIWRHLSIARPLIRAIPGYLTRGENDRVLDPFIRNLKLVIPSRVLSYLVEAGFGYIGRYQGHCKIEPDLISALVERWRPETHTFHLPCGECTITLEDVSMHLRLPVDGDVISGITSDANFWELSVDASEDEVKMYAWACILQLIGGLLMPDKLRNLVQCMWLRHLSDFLLAGSFSWGSAVLALLYREMCGATDYRRNAIGGCLLLLQSWAWYRLPFLCPFVKNPFVFPLLLRKNHQELPDDLEKIRVLIDQKVGTQFEWVPYSTDDVRAVIPPELRGPSDVWMVMVPLICYATVEWHSTDRVLWQFGCFQPILEAPSNMDELHSLDRRGKTDTDWLVRHHGWVMLWDDRHRCLPRREPIFDDLLMYAEDYYEWFNSNGKPFLLPEDAQGKTFPRRQQRRSPTQYHRPPTRGRRAGASGSSSAAPAGPSQQPPEPYMMTYLAGSASSPMAAAQTPPVQFSHSVMPGFSQFSQACGIDDDDDDDDDGDDDDDDDDDSEESEPVIRRNPPRDRQPPPCETHS
ncbi:hypothetical protein F3Y22_tig00113725pilonHSYRG01810 [Hibiscus syriacus]|uniref:Uncharacterized protein n=1 Tax=Hibiscus syriacus TaxID=106335 RepID=A0A6A2X0I8_HIBSY|nr:hypothetical protein F3Y22_tig00113725pilonHSYRG01810 [Hibiscus syriacus]